MATSETAPSKTQKEALPGVIMDLPAFRCSMTTGTLFTVYPARVTRTRLSSFG